MMAGTSSLTWPGSLWFNSWAGWGCIPVRHCGRYVCGYITYLLSNRGLSIIHLKTISLMWLLVKCQTISNEVTSAEAVQGLHSLVSDSCWWVRCGLLTAGRKAVPPLSDRVAHMRARSRVLHQGPAKYFLIIRSEMKRNVSASPILGCAERVLLCFRFQLKPYLVSLELEKYGWVVASSSSNCIKFNVQWDSIFNQHQSRGHVLQKH